MKTKQKKLPAKGSPAAPATSPLPRKKKLTAGRVGAGYAGAALRLNIEVDWRAKSGPEGAAVPADVLQSRDAFQDFSHEIMKCLYQAGREVSPVFNPGGFYDVPAWPDDSKADEYMAKFAERFFQAFFHRACLNPLTAFRFIKLLTEYADFANSENETFLANAPYLLRWPVALPARKEFAKERKEKLAKLVRRDVGGKHPERTLKPLRGQVLGDKIESYIVRLRSGFPGKPMLPILTNSTLPEYRAAAWKMFLREFGTDYENHPALKSIAPDRMQGQAVSPGKRRDMIRDAFEGSWKTRAKQVAEVKDPFGKF